MATKHTAKNGVAPSTPKDSAAHPAEERDETRAKASQTQRAKPAAQRSRQPAQQPKRKPYQMEIAALADTTAGLPPPWRKQAIHIVHAIIDLFKRVWRELRQPPAAIAADPEAHNPAESGDLTTSD